jgi:hypothetical protein
MDNGSNIRTAESLAAAMAEQTKLLRDSIIHELKQNSTDFAAGFYEAFKTYLIPGLSHAEFADMFSQTVTYGLFAARIRARSGFAGKTAGSFMPGSAGILKDMLESVSSGNLPDTLKRILDDIAEILAKTDVRSLLREQKAGDPGSLFIRKFFGGI